MDKKQKEEMSELFAQNFKEVVMPVLEDMHGDIVEIKERLSNVERDVDQIERTLVKIEDRLDVQGNKIEDNEKRIKTLETKVVVAA